MNKKIATPEFEIAPLRSLDDFLLQSARFQVPNVKDLDKWGTRVINNLLYYQSNYFLMSFLIFIVVGIIHPTKMAYGFFAMVIIFVVFCYLTNERTRASHFKRNHPIISIGLVLVAVYLITYLFGSLLVFVFGILLPISVAFVHASLRLRNLKNKFTNKVEMLGLKRSPMGMLLEELGLEIEIL